jgi:hypothetical protein
MIDLDAKVRSLVERKVPRKDKRRAQVPPDHGGFAQTPARAPKRGPRQEMPAMAARFPYETCEWRSGDAAQNRRWYEALERLAPENVRAILAISEVGSRAVIHIGAEAMTKGFAQEWLAWHDAQKAQRENTFRTRQP